LVGAGYGITADNQEVERAAIAVAIRHYESQGWSVRSVESEHRGYDLQCDHADGQIHVEVKGVAGTAVAIVLTENEKRTAESDPHFRLCVVTRALSDQPALSEWTGAEMKAQFTIRPLQYAATLKEASPEE
jgi:hypothetical protein